MVVILGIKIPQGPLGICPLDKMGSGQWLDILYLCMYVCTLNDLIAPLFPLLRVRGAVVGGRHTLPARIVANSPSNGN